MAVSLSEIFVKCRKIEPKDVTKNKYLMNAYKKKLGNYRIINSGIVIKNRWRGDKELPKHIIEFINEEGEVMVIANILLKQVTQIQFRAIEHKKFYALGSQSSIPYGLGFLNREFKFGDWLVITEGSSDRDALVSIYPNIIAVMTSGLSTIQRELLKNLTNKVILLYDNDETGRRGFYRDRKKLQKEGFTVEEIPYSSKDVGDPGDILQYKFMGKYFEAEQLEFYFKSWIDNIIGEIN